jgi:hypothetical protein
VSPVDQVTQRARRRLAARLLGIPGSRLASTDLPDLDATYFAEPVRGGEGLVVGVGPDGPEVLYCGSSAYPSQHYIEEFRRGRRTPLEQFEQRRAQG